MAADREVNIVFEEANKLYARLKESLEEIVNQNVDEINKLVDKINGLADEINEYTEEYIDEACELPDKIKELSDEIDVLADKIDESMTKYWDEIDEVEDELWDEIYGDRTFYEDRFFKLKDKVSELWGKSPDNINKLTDKINELADEMRILTDFTNIVSASINEEIAIAIEYYVKQQQYIDKIRKELVQDFCIQKDAIIAQINKLPLSNGTLCLSDNTASSQTHNNPKLSVAVVAPMSSGKSTLLNALLGRELLPSKNEACTATITIIEQDNQAEDFSAEILNEAQEILMSLSAVQPEVLDNLNEQEGITYIHLKGPIPTLHTEKQQVLELIDTPGPNNSRDAQHKMLTQTVLQNHPFDFILYVLNATQLGINDDYLLLHDVIQIASKDGQRDKNERVIFVLNKCDELDAEDGESINVIMQSVQDYLREVGFTQPRIIPVSALAARLIRQKQSGEILTRKEERDYDIYLSDGGLQHLEQYAQIPQKMKEKLTQQLKAAKQSGNQEKVALLHTGVPVLEMALNSMLDNEIEGEIVAENIIVQLEYNPYLQQTTLTINGEELAKHSKLIQIEQGGYLQDWLLENNKKHWQGLPQELADAINDDFTLHFIGRRIDFDDVEAAFELAKLDIGWDLQFEERFEEKTSLQELDKVINALERGRFKETFNTPELRQAYEKAKDTTFEVNVMATMSSGKSTLLNAMLGRELLPSKNEACTATVARIKANANAKNFTAECRDRNEKVVIKKQEITDAHLEDYNDNEKVYYIDLEGPIPTLQSDKMQLRLIDTPGPNNSRVKGHGEITSSLVQNLDTSMILYVLNATQLGINDDFVFFSNIADTIKKKGKLAQERILFVLNKCDELDPEDGEGLPGVIANVRKQLFENHGIENARIIPVTALNARIIRQMQRGEKPTRREEREIEGYVEDCLEMPELHFEQYADISPSCKKKLQEMLVNAQTDEEKALIYTGIPALELAIKEYLDKYVYPMKLADVQKAYRAKLDELEQKEKFAAAISKPESNRQNKKEEQKVAKNTIVQLEYNPYLKQIKIQKNGQAFDQTSNVRQIEQQTDYLQMWLIPNSNNWQGLPQELADAINDDFTLRFIGRRIDFDDVEAAFELAKLDIGWDLQFEERFEEKTSLQELDKVINALERGRFKETFNKPELRQAYEKAKDTTFDVNVMATMSSGKSTLLNAMLGRELLPSKNEACTATVARIKANANAKNFTAECRDRNEKVVIKKQEITDKHLDKYNDNEAVYYIDLEGPIPTLQSDKMQLRLIDTPGPNNSRVKEHGEITSSLVQNLDTSMILYVLNATQLGINDDFVFFSNIADTIKKKGKLAQERILFVLNKCDEFDSEDNEKVPSIITNVRKQLFESHGIENARIIPVTAFNARVIRQMQRGEEITKKERRDAEGFIEDCLEMSALHFEQYADISPSCKKKLQEMLANAQTDEEKALIHTGIPALELAIKEYLEKYAYPMKLTDMQKAYRAKLDGLEQKTKEAQRVNKENQRNIESGLNEKISDPNASQYQKNQQKRQANDRELNKKRSELTKQKAIIDKLEKTLNNGDALKYVEQGIRDTPLNLTSFSKLMDEFQKLEDEELRQYRCFTKVEKTQAKIVIEKFQGDMDAKMERFYQSMQIQSINAVEEVAQHMNRLIISYIDKLDIGLKQDDYSLKTELQMNDPNLGDFKTMMHQYIEQNIEENSYQEDIIETKTRSKETTETKKNPDKRWWTFWRPETITYTKIVQEEYQEKVGEQTFVDVYDVVEKNLTSYFQHSRKAHKKQEEKLQKEFQRMKDYMLKDKVGSLNKQLENIRRQYVSTVNEQEKVMQMIDNLQNAQAALDKQDAANKVAFQKQVDEQRKKAEAKLAELKIDAIKLEKDLKEIAESINAIEDCIG